MYGSVKYYTDCFMAMVMNKLTNKYSTSLESYYMQLKSEIEEKEVASEVKKHFQENLKQAYDKVYQNLVKMEEIE